MYKRQDLLGGGMNAYTTKEYTRFYTQTLAENARPAMELLADMLLHSRMAAEEMCIRDRICIGGEYRHR